MVGEIGGVNENVLAVSAKVDAVGGAVSAMSKKVTFGNRLAVGMGGGIKRIEANTANSAKKLEKLEKLETLEGQNDYILEYVKGIYDRLKKEDDKTAKVSMAGSPPRQLPFDDDCGSKPEVGGGFTEVGGYGGGAERGGTERGGAFDEGGGFADDFFSGLRLDDDADDFFADADGQSPLPGGELLNVFQTPKPRGSPPRRGLLCNCDEAKDEAPAPPPGSEEEHEIALAFPEGRVYEPAEEAAVKAPPASEAPRGQRALQDVKFKLNGELRAVKKLYREERKGEVNIREPGRLPKPSLARILQEQKVVDARELAAFGRTAQKPKSEKKPKRRYRPL